MVDEQDVGLVGRDETVALIELLVERRRQPLPIVVASGPGGSGKTALLDHLQMRYRMAPMARIDLDTTGSTSVRAILDLAVVQLLSYSHQKFGRLRLPRYRLARAAVGAEWTKDADPHREARALIGRQLDALPRLTRAITALLKAAPPGRWLGRLLEPFLHWLILAAVLTPRSVRGLFGSTGATLRWFERVAGRRLLQLDGHRADEVVAEIGRRTQVRDTRSRAELDRLLVEAFLADIAAAYRWRRHRRVNTMLLLDNADLLPGGESMELVDEEGRPDFLDVLAQARLALPDVPLLVVVTKQARSPGDAGTVASTDDDPVSAAYDRCAAWARAYDRAADAGLSEAVHLPVTLPPLGLEQTMQLLAEWNTRRGRTVETRELVEQLHEVSRGHPLAVRALYRRDRLPMSLRLIYGDPLHWSDRTGHWGQTVGGYLLARFLQRLEHIGPLDPRRRTSRPAERALAARDLLAWLAAPRRLDESIVRRLIDVGATDARALLAQLATFSFTTGAEEGELTFHPLLRDLLAGVLVELKTPTDGSAYLAVHRTLRDHFEEIGQRTDQLYHALALGGVASVATSLRPLLGLGSHAWLPRLREITEAPQPPSGQTPLAIRVRDQILRLANAEQGRIERLVRALWDLRSCTSVEPRTAALYTAVLDAFRALLEHDEIRRDDELLAFLNECERRRHALANRTPAPAVPPPPVYCRPDQQMAYPRFWPPRHTIRRVLIGGVTLAVVAYGAVYAVHRANYCNTPDVLDATTVIGEVVDGSVRLTRLADGQCIGPTSRPAAFAEGVELSGHAREVTRLTELIAAENAKVLERSRRGDDTRREYVTVVVAAMLSSTKELPQRDLSAGINELRGAYLAQRNYNRLDDKNSPQARLIRLVPANLGGNSEHAVETAKQIRDLVRKDPTVVAVTGLGQTRSSTIDAAEILGSEGPGRVPMVGSVASGNDFGGKQYFLRVGPSNDRQADVAVNLFAEAGMFAPDQAVFVAVDNDDAYSRDLADAFTTSIIEQGEADPGGGRQPTDVQRLAYLAGTARTPGSLRRLVQDMCARAGAARPILVYAGRTTELPTLITELRRAGRCGRDTMLLGGDDLSQLETAEFEDLSDREYVDGRLFFATFGATESGWRKRVGGALPTQVRDFFEAYDEVRRLEQKRPEGRRAYVSGTNGHIMLAYDAVGLVGEALTRIGIDEPVTRSRVFREMRATSGERPFPGAGGPVLFAPGETAVADAGLDPVNKLVVLQKVIERDGRLVAEYVDSDPEP